MNLIYATELTPKQWEVLEPLIPAAKSTGRPRTVSLMLVIQAILYVLVTGCAWRLLPRVVALYSSRQFH
jgi:putative transposase